LLAFSFPEVSLLPVMSSEKSIGGLPTWFVEGYREILLSDQEESGASREKMVKEGQSPKALWVGCCDSRVIPERILGAAEGDIFVVRNVANLVPPINTDSTSSGAAIEFAVGGLEIEDIIICGHEDCGGMKALMQGVDEEKMPYLSRWISYSQAADSVSGSNPTPQGKDLEKVIKENALRQVEHLETYPSVIEAEKTRGLRIHVLYYKLGNGGLQVYDRENDTWVLVS